MLMYLLRVDMNHRSQYMPSVFFEITLRNPVSCISPIITQRFYNFSYFLEMYLAFGGAGFLFSFLPALSPCYV